ncbi:hypothetical protein IQ241_01780 [Romeria aff. gracilis LEGE 07310]|uniref:Uncharacterized protein n=1 Tax=Vasconcelosia minhoensis LEGE 07310 TaxID=915328 RepID=A0A8J7AEP6_9CYAN|nr:hypothetical protein [Romeria gracilis]MBE9076033.1 hypothetical protein [Romeria aff. gracilis LEGE 07310]
MVNELVNDHLGNEQYVGISESLPEDSRDSPEVTLQNYISIEQRQSACVAWDVEAADLRRNRLYPLGANALTIPCSELGLGCQFFTILLQWSNGFPQVAPPPHHGLFFDYACPPTFRFSHRAAGQAKAAKLA